MTIKQYIKKHGLQWDCDPGLHRAMSIVITFINRDGEKDETEFSVSTQAPVNELSELFLEFCKENGFPNNTVQYVSVVRAAEKMNDLIELEL